jgi:hypothetical protein
MKKYFAFFLALIIALGMLTGCGSSLPDAKSDPDIHYVGEGETEGGIKSDAELANITQEAENGSTTEEPTYEDNTGHEPDGYSTGNFQDYWESTNYFDIVAYLKANGADNVYATNKYSYPVEDESNIDLYVATFYNEQWEITFMTGGGLTLGHAYCDENGLLHKDPHYIIPATSNDTTEMIVIDKNGTTTSMQNLNVLDSVIQYLKTNHDTNDPLNGSGINYMSQPL